MFLLNIMIQVTAADFYDPCNVHQTSFAASNSHILIEYDTIDSKMHSYE